MTIKIECDTFEELQTICAALGKPGETGKAFHDLVERLEAEELERFEDAEFQARTHEDVEREFLRMLDKYNDKKINVRALPIWSRFFAPRVFSKDADCLLQGKSGLQRPV